MLASVQQTSVAAWIEPTAIIAAGVVIAGWFVSFAFTTREVTHQNRRDTYAKVLGPAAQLLAVLHDTQGEASQWDYHQRKIYVERLAALTGAVGEVKLIGKNKVWWSADNFRESLAKPIQDPSVMDPQLSVTVIRNGNDARELFLLSARRTLESAIICKVRDRVDQTRAGQLEVIREGAEKQRAAEKASLSGRNEREAR